MTGQAAAEQNDKIEKIKQKLLLNKSYCQKVKTELAGLQSKERVQIQEKVQKDYKDKKLTKLQHQMFESALFQNVQAIENMDIQGKLTLDKIRIKCLHR